jgi:hypothetical protein
MTAPTDETIDGIAGLLHSAIYSKADVRKIVRVEITAKLPRQIDQPYCFGVKSTNRRYAKDIDDLAGKLLKTLDRMPSGSRDAFMILASKGEPEAWSPLDASSPAAKAFRQRLWKTLTDLRSGCGDICDPNNDIGDDLKRDRRKEICAGCAFDLIVGLDAGTAANYKEDSPVRVLAGLLYDAANPPDLKHQCAAVIAYWHSLSDADQRAHIDALQAGWEKLTGISAKKTALSR